MATKKPQVQIRRPPSVPQNADAFVAGVQAPKSLDAQTSSKPGAQEPEPSELPDVQPAERPTIQAPNHSGVEASKLSVKPHGGGGGDSPSPFEKKESAQASSLPSVQASKRSTLKRRDGRELRKMTLYLQPELGRRLAVRSAETGADMSEIVSLALDAYLNRA